MGNKTSKSAIYKTRQQITAKPRIRIIGDQGPVAQLLHPLSMSRRDTLTMRRVLQLVDRQLSRNTSGVKLVVTGGGFIELFRSEEYTPQSWRAEERLEVLTNFVRDEMEPVATALKNSERDYIIGVDVFDKNQIGGGQYAVALSSGKIDTLAWKSYPTVGEAGWLAGFGTDKGRNAQRVVSTSKGKAMLLVCHDSQAFNHRAIASAHKSKTTTDRLRAMESMSNLMRTQKPRWVFSLIHKVEKESSIKTFRTSYTQIHEDYHIPAVVGAFGYDEKLFKRLTELANKSQYPDKKANVIVILEPN